MNIRELKNPKTETYLSFKQYVLSPHFSWFWNNETTVGSPPRDEQSGYVNFPFLYHVFLIRPEATPNKIPGLGCEFVSQAALILLEILKYNDIKINYFLRMNANCILPIGDPIKCYPHIDHSDFPHKNLVVYLTDAGGKFFARNDVYDPKEDSVITFDGIEHYMETPIRTDVHTRRVCLVATFV